MVMVKLQDIIISSDALIEHVAVRNIIQQTFQPKARQLQISAEKG